MIDLVVGSVIGAFVSLVIAEAYHRRSSRETGSQIARLKEENARLCEMLDNLNEWQAQHYEDLQVIRKYSVLGTPDDPKYPYK